MAVHFLVAQLRFARSEFARCLAGISEENGATRIAPMNCISWMVGHLANQEQRYWITFPTGQALFPQLNDLVGSGKPASTPSLTAMWAAWQAITQAADAYLERLSTLDLEQVFVYNDTPLAENVGTLMLRNTYHYWFHTGEAHAVRQMLGHVDLPQFVGSMAQASYHLQTGE